MTDGTAATPSISRIHRRWPVTMTAVLLAVVLGAALSWCIVRMPMTLYDGLGPILDAEKSSSVWATFVGGLSQRGYFRPLRVAQIKLVFDLARGHEFFAYKAVHVGLTVASCALFAALLAPATSIELAAAAVAIMIFVGHHSFFILIGETYPINHFLEIVMLALLIAVLARRGHGEREGGREGREKRSADARPNAPPAGGAWWADALALMALVAGLLTLESGVLLWVVLVSGRLLGWRGVSKRAVVAATILVAMFFVWRVGVLHIGGPDLDERASGFGLRRLERFELAARFAGNPMPLYAYNVGSAVLTVLFSEPRAGTFVLLRQWLEGEVQPWMVSHVVSSAAVTLLIVGFAIGAVPRVWRRRADDRDRLLWLGLLLVGANAAVSYGYLKDEILSVGAAFYAAAAYAALAACGDRMARPGRAWLPVLVIPALVIVSMLWTLRAVGTFYGLRSFAAKSSHDWAAFQFEHENPAAAADPRTRSVYDRLRRTNLDLRVPIPFFTDEAEVQSVIEIR